jgi:hypothetical protein
LLIKPLASNYNKAIIALLLGLLLTSCSDKTSQSDEEYATKYPEVPTMGVTDSKNWGKF